MMAFRLDSMEVPFKYKKTAQRNPPKLQTCGEGNYIAWEGRRHEHGIKEGLNKSTDHAPESLIDAKE